MNRLTVLAGLLAVAAPAVSADDATFNAGRTSFEAKCALCHTMQSGAAHTVGPNLHGVLGRDIGRANGFTYSNALGSTQGKWDAAALSSFLQEPKKFAPGTVMPFAGLKSEKERKALVCYLSGEPAGNLCQ